MLVTIARPYVSLESVVAVSRTAASAAKFEVPLLASSRVCATAARRSRTRELPHVLGATALLCAELSCETPPAMRTAAASALLAAAAAGLVNCAAAAEPPTGRWDGEASGGAPSGHLGNPGHNVPLLGNGYLGLVLQSSPIGIGTHGVNFNGTTVEFFLNTNANWDCEASKTGAISLTFCPLFAR